MIRHLFTLMWNRKRSNGLLIVEILLAFVVLFVVGSVGVYSWRNYQSPLGFAYENVWEIDLNPGLEPPSQQFATWQRIVARLRSTPGVLAVTRSSSNPPFSGNTNNTSLETASGPDHRSTEPVDYYDTDSKLQSVMGVALREGRWFDARDEAATHQPVIINEQARAALFPPGARAVGQLLKSGSNTFRVVGVSGAYRAGGELSTPQAAMFVYVNAQDTARALSTLLVRVQPGAGAVLEKVIREEIRAIGPAWSSNVVRLSEQRTLQLKRGLTLPVVLGIVCLFLVVNVALGLLGVLWLNINQRRGELGVRRALGATGPGVSSQIVGEMLIVTTFGLLLGLLVAVQFPLLGVFGVSAGVYGTAILLAGFLLYALVLVCALYPSLLAARIRPAVALREE